MKSLKAIAMMSAAAGLAAAAPARGDTHVTLDANTHFSIAFHPAGSRVYTTVLMAGKMDSDIATSLTAGSLPALVVSTPADEVLSDISTTNGPLWTSMPSGAPVNQVYYWPTSSITPLPLTPLDALYTSPRYAPSGTFVLSMKQAPMPPGAPVSLWRSAIPGGAGSAVAAVGGEDRLNHAISPDGTQVAFLDADAGGFLQVYVGPPAAVVAPPRQVTFSPTHKFGLSWSRDSRVIGYVARDTPEMGPAAQVTVVDVGTLAERTLTTDAVEKGFPSFAPDGRAIAFTYSPGPSSEIRVVPVDGSPMIPVSIGPGFRTQPEWSPDGKRIAYVLFGGPAAPSVWITDDIVLPPPPCRANCTGDTDPVSGRPILDIRDFSCFQNAFAVGDMARADLGGPITGCGAPDGLLDIADFTCFQNLFALGCP